MRMIMAVILLVIFTAAVDAAEEYNLIERRIEDRVKDFLKENPKLKDNLNAEGLIDSLRQDKLTEISPEEIEKLNDGMPLHTKDEFDTLLKKEKKTSKFRNLLDKYLLQRIKAKSISKLDQEVLYRYFSFALLSRERRNYLTMQARAKSIMLACRMHRLDNKGKLPANLKELARGRYLQDKRAMKFLDMQDMKEKDWRYDAEGKIRYGEQSLVLIAPAETMGNIIIGLNNGSVRPVSPEFLASLEKISKENKPKGN